MDRVRVGAVLFAVLVALGGCASKKETPPQDTSDTPTTTTTAVIGEASAARPEWSLGQGWTYTVEVPGQPTRKFEMVVAEDRDDLWVVASNDRAQAMHHAVYSTNPMLGRIGKETLSPFQSGKPVLMYQFPLIDQKTWTGEFFGETKTFTAVYAGDIDVSRVNAKHNLGKFSEGFRVTAKGSSGQKVLYDYVTAAEWFTSFEVIGADGEREIKLTLTDLEAAYKGNYFFFRAKDALVETMTHEPSAGLTAKTLEATIEDGFDDEIAIGLQFTGQAGTVPPTVNLTLKDPAGTAVWSRDFNTATQVLDLRDFVGKAGKWTIDLRLTGTVSLEVRIVGIANYALGAL